MADIAIVLVPYYHTFAPAQVRPYCLNYTNSAGELASTRFIHNASNLNVKGLYQLITGQLSSVNTHEFDNWNRIIRKTRKFSNGDYSEEQYTYNKSGKLLSESFSNSKGVEGRVEYVYNEDGNAERMICDRYKGWFSGEIVFTFDKSGKRVSGVIERDGKPDGSIEYKYEGGTNLVLESWKTSDGWTQTLNYVYEPID